MVACAALPLRAQSVTARVEGTVFDSVTMRALGGARVQLVPNGNPAQVRTAEADGDGRFAFDGVAGGEYLLGFMHPVADSLTLTAPMIGVIVRTAGVVRATLSLPSAATLVARACKRDFARDSVGVLIGTVRDARDGAPRRGAKVHARWRDLVVRDGGLFESNETAEATTLDDGRFALCGIPSGVTAVLVAGAGADSSGTFEVALPAHGFAVRDVMVGRGERRRVVVRDSAGSQELDVFRGEGRVRGRVLRPDGAPIAGALVRTWRGDRESVTDAEGAFLLDSLPTGTQTVDVRAIGFFPRRVAMDVAAAEVAAPPLVLDAMGVTIDTVRIVGQRVVASTAMRNFEARRRRGSGGHFMNEQEIERKNPLYLTDLLRQIPGVLVVPRLQGIGFDVFMSGGEAMSESRRCTPEFWIDGMPVPNDFEFNAFVGGYDIRAIEVYTRAVQLPAEFQNMKGCGAVVVWTGARQRVAR